MRVLVAPETSYRLLARGQHDLIATGEFLMSAFKAEVARDGGDIPFQEETWTAVGDMCFDQRKAVKRFPVIEEFVPLDFGSPHAINLDFEGFERETPMPQSEFEPAEIEIIMERLTLARDVIAQTSIDILTFVVQFTKVLVLKRDVTAPRMFSSGSNNHCICRTMLVNAHAETTDAGDVADALVHEAIHALLMMQELKRAWSHDSRKLVNCRTLSPWTGNNLRLYSFIQACFVWYGLFHFWSIARLRRSYESERIEALLDRARNGFLAESLLEKLGSVKDEVSPEILKAIEAMQANVRCEVIVPPPS
jgi:hypothetical protein